MKHPPCSPVVVLLAATGLLFMLTGCNSVSDSADYTPTVARFYLEAGSGDVGEPAILPQSGTHISVLAKPVFMGTDIVNVELVQVELGQCLMFQLTQSAGRDLYRLTASNQGRRLVLGLNGVPMGVRVIDRPLGTSSILTFVELPEDALAPLVENLKRTSEDLQKKIARET